MKEVDFPLHAKESKAIELQLIEKTDNMLSDLLNAAKPLLNENIHCEAARVAVN